MVRLDTDSLPVDVDGISGGISANISSAVAGISRDGCRRCRSVQRN